MAEIYQEYVIKPEDSPETRRSKLYLGVISMGEELYCLGSAVRETLKKLDALEPRIAEMRRELESIKECERGREPR